MANNHRKAPVPDELARERAKAMAGLRGATGRIAELDAQAQAIGMADGALEAAATELLAEWDRGSLLRARGGV